MSAQLDLRHPVTGGRCRSAKAGPSPLGNEVDLLACLAEAAAAAPSGSPVQPTGDAWRTALGSHQAPSPPIDGDATGSDAAMTSEREVHVVCNGNHGTFNLSTQTVRCHCARCEATNATAGPGNDGVTPTVFERHSGLLTAKKWRNSIRLAEGDGTVTIGKWLEQHNILPRPKCNGHPAQGGSPAQGGAGSAATGATGFGAAGAAGDGQGGYQGGPSSGNDSHTGGGAAAGSGGGSGRGEPAGMPALRSTLPPSRYPASEYVTGEEEEYDTGGGNGGRGGAAGGGGADEDDEDYRYDARPYGGEGGDGHHGYGGARGGRRPSGQRAGRMALGAGPGTGSGSGSRGGLGKGPSAVLGRGGQARHRSRQTAGRGGGGVQFRGMVANGDIRRGGGGGHGSSSQEADGGGGGVGPPGHRGHSSSEGSPQSPSDREARDGSGGSGEGDGSGTGDGGESARLPPPAEGEMDAEQRHDEEPHGYRHVSRQPSAGMKTLPPLPHAPQPHRDNGGLQDRSARHAGAVKRMPPEYLTGADISPAIKRARTARPFANAAAGGAAAGLAAITAAAAAAAAANADEPAALCETGAAVMPQVCGWRFLGPAAGSPGDQVLISVTINGRAYTGLLAPQQVAPQSGPMPGRPPLATPFGGPAGAPFPPPISGRRSGPARNMVAAAAAAGPMGRSLPPAAPPSRLGLAQAPSAGAETVDAAASALTLMEDEAYDDGLPADCPRCAFCHRCASPVLALPPPPATAGRLPSSELAMPAAATVTVAGYAQTAEGEGDKAVPMAAEGVQLRLQRQSSDNGEPVAPAASADAPAAETTTSAGTEDAPPASTRAPSAISAPSAPAVDATPAEVMSPVARADGADATGKVGGGAAAAETADAVAPAMEAEVPELPGAKADAETTAAAAAATAVGAPPTPPLDIVKREEIVKVEGPPPAAAGPVATTPAVAAEASRTSRQTGAGLGPLVEVKGAGGSGGGAPLRVHSQCALWSPDVFVISSNLYGVQGAVKRCRGRRCTRCGRSGATLSCCSGKCSRAYHLPCAMEAGAMLVAEPFSMACPDHAAALHSHNSGSCQAPARPAATRAPRAGQSQSLTDASQNTAATTTTTTTTNTIVANGNGLKPHPNQHQHVPRQQVELPASLQNAVGRRVAMPPPSSLPNRSVSEPAAAGRLAATAPPPTLRAAAGGAGGAPDVSGLPALMMLRSQPGGGGAAAAVAYMPPLAQQQRANAVHEQTPAGGDGGALNEGSRGGEEGVRGPELKRSRLPDADEGAMRPPTLTAHGKRMAAARAAAAAAAALAAGHDGANGGGGGGMPEISTASDGTAVFDAGGQGSKRRRQEHDEGDAGAAADGGGRFAAALGDGGVPAVFMARATAAAAAAGLGGGDGDDPSPAATFLAALRHHQQNAQQQLHCHEQGAVGGFDAQDAGIHALLMAAQGHFGNGGGGEVSVDSPLVMHPSRGVPAGGGGGRQRHLNSHLQPAAGASASTASGSTAVTTFGRGSAGAGGGISGGAGDESPPHMQGHWHGVHGIGGGSPGMHQHVLPRAARNIEGLLPSRPLLHNPYVPSSGDPSADLALSKIAQNGSREVEAELLGGTTGRAGHTGRCAVCVIQRKGKCGTESAPKKCLRRQLVALQRATGGSVGGMPGLPGGGLGLGGAMLPYDIEEQMQQYIADAEALGAGVGGAGSAGLEPEALPYMDERVAAAAAEQRARERARRETWSLPLGQGSGATGKRPPQ